ncbi:hypothetical protein KP509_03G044800 [Ceratopteris richardii]|uniref:F-box protein n=1 Tax=Ceratopteris richardii TaxID=49495 RepID=A0A8T2UZD6_CERRI|nr:hypothetical protein KP509_03G044800 [Ceratopteris richardii]KAH7441592.1 hypothetical protein KP509_03G044800 [Ceratopteris richardii]
MLQFLQRQPSQGRSTPRKGLGNKIDPWKGGTGGAVDLTLCLNDEVILRILGLLPISPYPYSQVCKRWLRLHGQIRTFIKVLDWKFLESGRMSVRFPNLTDIDLTPACLSAIPRSPRSINVVFTHRFLSIYLDVDAYDPASIERFIHDQQLSPATLDKSLKILADAYPELQRLCVADVRKADLEIDSHSNSEVNPTSLDGLSSTEKLGEKVPDLKESDSISKQDQNGNTNHVNSVRMNESNESSKMGSGGTFHEDGGVFDHGLSYVARNCHTLQELELHHCSDESLNAISACENLQIVRLIGSVSDFYHCSFTDIGLTILARSCVRLVKLDLSGCEASYDGLAAIGQCCIMLEELTISNHGFSDGWLAALSFCSCLKTLRLENCKQIDPVPGPLEHLGYCVALEHLQLVRCDLRDPAGFQALMLVSINIRDLELQDCWGLDDEIFAAAAVCRHVKILSLEGCSPLTTVGLEKVILVYKELQALRVMYCNNVKDSEISPDLALQFGILKELKWRPDAKSFLSMSLAGTGIGYHGGKFFKKGGPS